MKIKTKITINFSLIVGAILLLFSMIILFFSSNYREEQFYSRLKDKALTTSKLLFEVEQVDSVLMIIIDRADQTLLYNEKVVIYEEDLHKIYESREEIPVPFSTEIVEKLKHQNEIRENADGFEIFGKKVLNAGKTYYVIASAYDKYGFSKIGNLLKILGLAMLTSVSLLFLSGRFFAERLVRPVSDIVAQVEKIDISSLSSRVEGGDNKDEISQLADAFNNMLERLEAAFIVQRNFVSNASHELRTPLTAIIGQIDVALQKPRNSKDYSDVLMSVKEDIIGFISLSNKLLMLAQTDTKFPTFTIADVRMDECIWQARHDVLKQNQSYKVFIHFEKEVDDEKKLLFSGSELLMKTAFHNLIENACKYSWDHTAEVWINADENCVSVSVYNNSKEISADEMSMFYQPFFRASNSSGISGHGIGLPLVRNIVEIHGGIIENFYEKIGERMCFKISIQKQNAPGAILSANQPARQV